MTKAELITAMKDFPDNMKVIGSSVAHNDTFEIKQVINLDDGVIYLELI